MNAKHLHMVEQQQAEPILSGLQQRIRELIAAVSTGMYEREEIIAVAMLGALCGQNTFLYGPPGTAKSLISRRIACAFDKPVYFEYLMNRFSTPEEVFGPVSIKALKEDRYTRKTDCYLPKAEFAFLDEIWKSSPAILNTLLTLINEHVFRNGEVVEKAPLKALIAASNETPDTQQGLEALFDRFILRLMVGPINQVPNFEQLLDSKPTEAAINIPAHLLVKPEEWQAWRTRIHDVALSPETLTIIHLIREELVQRYEELKVYVSDRRWQRAAVLLKAAAFFNGRMETNHSDALLLQHCLWTQEDNRGAVMEIVANAVKETGFASGISLAEIDREKDRLDQEIMQELYHSEDVYETEMINGEAFFNILSRDGRNIFIPQDAFKTEEEIIPVDESGNEITRYRCEFDGQGSCKVTDYHGRYGSFEFKPNILFHKGDKKNINARLIKSLAKSVSEIRKELIKKLEIVQIKRNSIEKNLSSLFTPPEKTEIAIQGITEQIDNLKLRITDCERLEGLCH